MQIALITGGSSGIGLEISKRFAKNGYAICWVSLFEQEIQAAKKELLGEYPNTTMHTFVQDLSKEEGAQNAYNWVQYNKLEIDVLINNAGYATYGMSSTIPYEKEVNMINLNVLNLYRMTRLFLKDMTDRNSGTIINISSSTSLQPVPRMAAYAATKAFVAHYSQGLNQELKEQGSNVKVITICPAGIKDTQFKVAAKMENVKTFDGALATTKREVADDLWKAFSKGHTYCLTGSRLRSLNWIIQRLPRSIIYKAMKNDLSEKVL